MTSFRTFAVVGLLAILSRGTQQLRAADEVVLEAHVTQVYDDTAFLSRGAVDGVRPGDLVIVNGWGGQKIHTRILAVSDNEARSKVERAQQLMAWGATAEVIVPADRLLPLPTHDQPSSFAVRPANAEFVTQAPAGLQRLEVQVTAASGNSVYLDKGRADGIQPGDEVILFPIGRPTVNAAIQNVSRTNCRCSVLSGTTAIDVGTRGEVLIPADRLQESSESNPPLDSRPDHPPWTRPPDNWSQDQPLLAPAYSQAPDERTPSFHGRMYIQYLHTWNQNYYDNQYSLGRTGTALWYENPFRQGGTLHLQGEFNRRGVFLEDVENQFSEPGRLDRVSYVRGGAIPVAGHP